MKACKHYETFIGMGAHNNAPVLAATYPLPRVPVIYQEQPKHANGAGILPHRWTGSDGRPVLVNGGEWDTASKNEAALGMAEWCAARYAKHRGPIVLNVESIPLNTPEARSFWTTTLDAMRTACPLAMFGFYGRPDMPDVVDFLAPSVYPIKRVREEVWGDNEHEQTPARYRQVALANIAAFDRTGPMYAFCAMRIWGDWCTTLEVREQWRLAQDLGLDVLWWGSLGSPDARDTRQVHTDVARARKLCTWLTTQPRIVG